MGLIAMLPNYNPACRKSFTIVETVKEASAVCRSFLDGVVILFYKDYWKKLQNLTKHCKAPQNNWNDHQGSFGSMPELA